MFCPACHKRVPDNDRYCAYCGANLGWRVMPGLTLPRLRLPARWHLSGAAAAFMGAAMGLFVAAPFANIWLGAFLGAVSLGASAMFADMVAGAIPDPTAAERFGRGLGLLGGVLVVPGAFVTSLIVAFWHGAPHSLRDGWALLLAGLFLGLICAAGGALIGAAGGTITGSFAGRVGYDAAKRQGAIYAAGAAWTMATLLGGLFAGDFAARIVGASEPVGAIIGISVQVLGGAALLPVVRRVLRRWRGWWTGRP